MFEDLWEVEANVHPATLRIGSLLILMFMAWSLSVLLPLLIQVPPELHAEFHGERMITAVRAFLGDVLATPDQ